MSQSAQNKSSKAVNTQGKSANIKASKTTGKQSAGSSKSASTTSKASATSKATATSKASSSKSPTSKATTSKTTTSKTAVTEGAADITTGAIDRKRTFKICRGDGTFCSRLTGKTPKQAANKALTALLREAKREGKVTEKSPIFNAEFTIRETTRGGKSKEYSYTGTRERLAEPTVYSIKDGDVTKEIVNNFRNRVLKAKV